MDAPLAVVTVCSWRFEAWACRRGRSWLFALHRGSVLGVVLAADA